MPVTADELRAILPDVLGVEMDELAEVVRTGKIAKKRDAARRLWEYATGFAANQAQPLRDELGQLEAKQAAMLSTLTVAVDTLTNGDDCDLPTKEEVETALTA